MMQILRASVPSVAVAVLVLGLASPAFADIGPGPRERTTRTLEPHKAPPMTPPPEEPPQPEEGQPKPPSQQAPPSVEASTPEAPPPQEQPKAADEAKNPKDEKAAIVRSVLSSLAVR